VRTHDLAALEYPRVLEAIAALARSAAGRAAVRALEPAPASDAAGRARAERRLDTIAALLARLPDAGAPPIGDVPLLAPVLAGAGAEGAALETRRLVELREILAAARALDSWLRRDGRFPVLEGWAAELPDVSELAAALRFTLDDAGQVKDDASPELAAARGVVRELRAQMEARLARLLRDPQMADVLGEDYVTIRNGRFVVPVRTQAVNAVPGVVQDRSQTGETVFLEPLFAVELNNRLVLAQKDADVAEHRVRAELTALVRAHGPALGVLEEVLATIESLAAAAAFAARHGCTRPTLGAEDVRLEAARHPLLAAGGRRVVGVDLRLPRDRRGLAITGPNAGGKTVALKTLGLSAVMAHAGLFVPAAEGGRLPLLDAVLVDIGDEQSIDRDLSTFTAHVTSLAAIARASGPGALVLLDEPGAGTDPVEGSAIAVGLLTDLLERGPRVVFTSHFPQVKTYALATPALDVAAFDVDPATGAPRFTLAYHSIGQSLALPIARRHGLPPRAIAVAESLLAGESHDLARAVARLEASRRALDAEREAAEAERARLEDARATTERLLAELRERRRDRWRQDLEESRRVVRDVEARGRAILDELRRKPEPATLRRFVRETGAELTARAAETTAPPDGGGAPPVPGDLVEVAGSAIRGELLEVTGDRARIQRGGMRFEVPAAQLRRTAGRARGDDASRERVAVDVHRPATETPELNLVGRRVRDAIAALDAFLDRAVRTGLTEVRIVHGVGTGALRRAVHDRLATSPYQPTWADADAASGGAGVTVVSLA